MNKRAKAGGEFGANGEFYEGGKFLNTVAENNKREGSKPKAAPRKQQIAPYQWEMAPSADSIAIFSFVGSALKIADFDYNSRRCALELFEPFLSAAYNKVTSEQRAGYAEMVERFNNGERWL